MNISMTDPSMYYQRQVLHQPYICNPLTISFNGNQPLPRPPINLDREFEHINLGEKTLIDIIKKTRKTLLCSPTELRISIHEKTKRISIKIINSENQEVIREIPPEKTLDMVAKMWELAGLIINEKV